jgi:hypothetical protein
MNTSKQTAPNPPASSRLRDVTAYMHGRTLAAGTWQAELLDEIEAADRAFGETRVPHGPLELRNNEPDLRAQERLRHLWAMLEAIRLPELADGESPAMTVNRALLDAARETLACLASDLRAFMLWKG